MIRITKFEPLSREWLFFMDNSQIISQLADELRAEFANESTGHDWFHIERVWKNARYICEKEGGNLFLTELAALLHDIADHKFVVNADEVAAMRITSILSKWNMDQEIISKVIDIVKHNSFKGGLENKMTIKEGFFVQDADRLDAIGAIGIARTFAYGGKAGS
ncbi:MAG: HD domain-containing protein, partial [Crocinitomicaceae bacterium]|nr:HD domain-containing protein [Crocinitomicaceae bacterium]